MGLPDIDGRDPILKAVAEFDRLGRQAFLRKYGFGKARSYFLQFNDALYDSKAILGAAHGYARPDLGPLTASEFSGGDSTVRPKLEELGFIVTTAADGERTSDALEPGSV